MPDLVTGVNPDGSVTSVIRIDFERGTEDPGRVFRAAAELIDSFHVIDSDLARTVGIGLRPIILLEDIKSGSILVRLRTLIEQIDDGALYGLDWKPLIGQYLVKGKHRLLRFLNEKNKVESIAEIHQLQDEIRELSPSAELNPLFEGSVVPAERLLKDIELISDALDNLNATDTAEYVTEDGSIRLNQGFRISSDRIEELLTHEVVAQKATLVLKVKKPDYLGMSRWELKHEDHIIEAKILDAYWLSRFQAGELQIQPGDSIRAVLRAEIKRGKNGELVASRYSVTRVFGIVRGPQGGQSEIPF